MKKGKTMKTMIQLLGATLLFAAPLPAFAQGMPVHDSASLIQQINTVRQTIEMVEQGKEQIAEAQKLYEDLNKLTDIPTRIYAGQARGRPGPARPPRLGRRDAVVSGNLRRAAARRTR